MSAETNTLIDALIGHCKNDCPAHIAAANVLRDFDGRLSADTIAKLAAVGRTFIRVNRATGISTAIGPTGPFDFPDPDSADATDKRDVMFLGLLAMAEHTDSLLRRLDMAAKAFQFAGIDPADPDGITALLADDNSAAAPDGTEGGTE